MKLKKPDYFRSIMNVSNSLLHYYNIDSPYPGLPELDEILQKNNPNHIVLVLFDGLGVNAIKEHLTKDDALYKYMVSEITSVFPPTTVAATNAVLSGNPPITTGYLGWVQYFKKEDANIAVFLNKDYYTNKIYEETIRDKYLSYDDIFTKIHQKNPDIITNRFFPGFIDGSDNNTLEDEINKALMVLHNTDYSCSYLYWTEPDLTEHTDGITGDKTKQVIKQINKEFTNFIENIPENTLCLAIADHGLTDVLELNITEYEDVMNMLVRMPSIEPRATTFFVKEEYIDSFKDTFNKHFEGKYVLINKQEVFESNTFGEGIKHPLVDQFVGDYLAIAVDKYMFSLNNKKTYKAHHAGLTTDEMMVPFIVYKK